MRTKTWIRFSLASAIFTVGALGVLASGCSDDDNGDASDGSPSDQIAPPIDSPVDAPKDVPTPPTPKYPRIALVHGAAGLPAVKFCIAVDESTFTINTPLPEGQTGIPYGTGGYLPISPAIATLIPGVALTAYAIPVTEATAGKTCQDLTKAEGGAPNFVKFTKFPAGTFQNDHTYFVVALGCGPGGANAAYGDASDDNYKQCGGDWTSTGTGNQRIAVVEVDRATSIGANEIGAQFYHLSPQVNAKVLQGTGDAAVNISPTLSWPTDAAADATPDAPIQSEFLTNDAGVKYDPDGGATGLHKSSAVLTHLGGGGVNAYVSALNQDGTQPTGLLSGIAPYGLPFAFQPFLAYAPADGGAAANLKPGSSYTFIAAGDPNRSAQAGDQLGFRIFVIPNDPVLPPDVK